MPIDFRGSGRVALSISKSAYDWFITRQWGKEFHTPSSRRWWAGIKAHKTSAKEAKKGHCLSALYYLLIKIKVDERFH